MPFCLECGNNYPDEAKFCPHCGKPNKLTKTETPTIARSNEPRQRTDISGGGSYGLSVNNIPDGTTLEDGRYTIIEKLGEGGFGVVYKASDANYDGVFKALKVIYSDNYSDRLVMSKLKTEAVNMIKINHPNVLRLYDVHFQSDVKFIDMEFIDGGDLVDLMLRSPGNKIPEEKVWQLATQIAQGMQAIHSVNIIHQDLKPENILLTQEGLVKITDFGLSETFRSSKSRIEESDVKGTFVYASPEQLIGKNVGKEADVWSYGTTLYHLLTGNTLYAGITSNEIITQIERREFEPIPRASDKMNALLAKCLKREYKERFRDFDEVLSFIKKESEKKVNESLSKVNPNPPDSSAQVSTSQPISTALNYAAPEKVKKKKNILVFVIIFLIIIIISTFIYFNNQDNSNDFDDFIASLSEEDTYAQEENESIDLIEEYTPAVATNELISRDFVYVEGGSFLMGASDGKDDEMPQHYVTLSSFYIDKYEVTQADWKEVVSGNPSFSKGNDKPVEQVSWYDALEFCNMKSRKEGLEEVYSGSENDVRCDFTKNGYRLPTEAEWEYAARGGNKTQGYEYSGSDNIDEVAEYADTDHNSSKPVGGKKPNELGIYDMSGNIWEWCWDWHGDYKNSSQTNPSGPSKGTYRVFRGGCWIYRASYSRIANRGKNIPSYSNTYVGFRLVRNAN